MRLDFSARRRLLALYVSSTKMVRLATLYSINDKTELVVTRGLGGDYSKSPATASGGGGSTSLAADYLRFAQMFLNGGQLDGIFPRA